MRKHTKNSFTLGILRCLMRPSWITADNGYMQINDLHSHWCLNSNSLNHLLIHSLNHIMNFTHFPGNSPKRHHYSEFDSPESRVILTHHGPVPHICVAIFSAYFRSAPDMWRWFQCSFPQCPIHGAWQTARSSPVPQIVVARPHLLSHQRPIYVARHGPLS